jgi:hypothetical protein
MWRSIGPSVFLSETGEVHVCCQGCDQRSVRMAGIDVAEFAAEEIAPHIKSSRYVDPLNLDGALAVKNASQRVFSLLFAKRICKPDADILATIAVRFPGRDPQPIMASIKAKMLCSSDIDDITK